jgi:hypothetical protein
MTSFAKFLFGLFSFSIEYFDPKLYFIYFFQSSGERERERERERESLKNVKEERKLTNVQCLMKKSIVLGVNEFQLTRGVSYRYFLLLF